MDAVFSLFSFGFKYLLQPLRNDIKNFYSVYIELLQHKNRFIRKFAAQAFSYVLRKVPFSSDDKDDEQSKSMANLKILHMLMADSASEDQVLGLTDLLFEVCKGQQEDLHSKAPEVLTALLTNEKAWFTSGSYQLKVMRYLWLKLTNAIDTQKQLPMFKILTTSLAQGTNETSLLI